ncbi:MAG: fused DSP-PTPase phosphatase/NAD kinase-like protein [Caulobacteraceae bacterium]
MSKFDLTTAGGRLRTTVDHLWNDHAYLRLGFSNAHWISDELVRANQPWPFQLKAWRDRGIRTVINLRGGFDASFRALEVEACERLGLELVDFVIASRDVPTAEKVLGARDLFETVRYPALMHCKSGADRAGIMAVFYKHFRQGLSIREALDQLSPRYLHVKAGLTGVLDYIFERYLAEGEPAGLSFVEWVQSPAYDPVAMKAEFKAGWWGTALNDKLLRRE